MIYKRLIRALAILSLGMLIGSQDQFIGSKTCSNCHPDQFNTWKTSTHGKAGGNPTDERVLAPFDGKKIKLFDMKSSSRKVVEKILELDDYFILGIGNMVGWGETFINKIKRHSL